jgi:hypothetical protein
VRRGARVLGVWGEGGRAPAGRRLTDRSLPAAPCRPRRRCRSAAADFRRRWLAAHLEAAAELGKPLLLEEFGVKLRTSPAGGGLGINATEQAARRDPIVAAVYAEVAEALAAGQPLVGSLLWRWSVPVFAGQGPGAYGVRPGSTTLAHIEAHARAVNEASSALPPSPPCASAGCWLPHPSQARACVPAPAVCSAFWALRSEAGAPGGGGEGQRPLQLYAPLLAAAAGRGELAAARAAYNVSAQEVCAALRASRLADADIEAGAAPAAEPPAAEPAAADCAGVTSLVGMLNRLLSGEIKAHPSRHSCCRPASGAFPAGCASWPDR